MLACVKPHYVDRLSSRRPSFFDGIDLANVVVVPGGDVNLPPCGRVNVLHPAGDGTVGSWVWVGLLATRSVASFSRQFLPRT